MMISKIKIYLRFVGVLILFYLRGCKINPSRVLHIQQIFYHKLKGLLDKKILPYLTRVEEGDSTYVNSLVGSALEMHEKFRKSYGEILRSLPPTRQLLLTLLMEEEISRKATQRDIGKLRELLPQFHKQTRRVFVEECGQYSFDLTRLLASVVDEINHDYRDLINTQQIKLNFEISRGSPKLYIPFNETSAWREILRNFIINAAEACEGDTDGNSISIKCEGKPNNANRLQVTIADTGCGMIPDILSSFHKREFTSGKESGSGLGIVEEYIDFLNRRGKFRIDSVPDKGTNITIEVDPEKAEKVGDTTTLYRQRNRIVKLGILIVLLILFLYIAGAFKLVFPPAPEYANFIAGFTPGELADEDIPNEFESIKIRTETGEEHRIEFKSAAIKIAHGDSVGPICYDIDRDGKDEMIAAILPAEKRHHIAAEIRCYTADGEEEWDYPIEYEKRLEERYPLNRQTDAELPQMFVMDINNDGAFEIICLAIFSNGISQLCILTGEGELIQKYIHYGRVTIYEFAFHRQDRPRDPALAGINFELGNKPVLTKIQIAEGVYQSPPYGLANIEPAEEDYYILDRPEDSGINGFEPGRFRDTSEFCNCFVIGRDENLYVFQVDDGRMLITPHSLGMVSLDYDTRLFEEWWDTLIANGVLPARSYSNDDLIALGKVYRWNDSAEIANVYNDSDSLTKVFRGCIKF